jgi:DNA-binding Lrp family transcriptional regulator
LTQTSQEELEGITLDVYLQVLKKGKPVGPREVMKAVNLSSPSVAYRHLQKLEDLGYLQKNGYGEYIAKNKAHITGYVWIGHHLIPKMWRYSLIFLAVLTVELVVLAIHYRVETYEFKVFFLLLILVTVTALGVFTREGLLQNRRKHYKKVEDA